jgi:hypothetical protein
LLKKGHLLRFPHPSLLRRTIKYASLLPWSGLIDRISVPPQNGISQSSTCICLPAEASAQAGPFFEQPGKEDFFRSLLPIPSFRKSCNVFILGFRNSKNCNSFRGVYLG